MDTKPATTTMDMEQKQQVPAGSIPRPLSPIPPFTRLSKATQLTNYFESKVKYKYSLAFYLRNQKQDVQTHCMDSVEKIVRLNKELEQAEKKDSNAEEVKRLKKELQNEEYTLAHLEDDYTWVKYLLDYAVKEKEEYAKRLRARTARAKKQQQPMKLEIIPEEEHV